ncbi:MAG: HNH endonuclease signature motif containing protein [Nanoarchaeota archaeon]
MGRPKGHIPWNKGTKGLIKPNKGSFQKGRKVIPWNKGKKMPNGFGEKISKLFKGKKHSEETKIKIAKAKKGKKRQSFSPEWRRKMSESHLKVRHLVYTWKGGITPINEKIRHSLEYKLWREAIFKRDNYTCVWCGSNKSGTLNADHIQNFADYPELRFAIDNGRTLCKSCHSKRHSRKI